MRRTAEVIYQELLVLRCRRGKKAALEELVHTWEKRLFYFIRRLVDDEQDAWDVLQQTWLRVLAGIAALREPGSLGPWLYRVARHAAFNHGQVRATYQRFLLTRLSATGCVIWNPKTRSFASAMPRSCKTCWRRNCHHR